MCGERLLWRPKVPQGIKGKSSQDILLYWRLAALQQTLTVNPNRKQLSDDNFKDLLILLPDMKTATVLDILNASRGLPLFLNTFYSLLLTTAKMCSEDLNPCSFINTPPLWLPLQIVNIFYYFQHNHKNYNRTNF